MIWDNSSPGRCAGLADCPTTAMAGTHLFNHRHPHTQNCYPIDFRDPDSHLLGGQKYGSRSEIWDRFFEILSLARTAQDPGATTGAGQESVQAGARHAQRNRSTDDVLLRHLRRRSPLIQACKKGFWRNMNIKTILRVWTASTCSLCWRVSARAEAALR